MAIGEPGTRQTARRLKSVQVTEIEVSDHINPSPTSYSPAPSVRRASADRKRYDAILAATHRDDMRSTKLFGSTTATISDFFIGEDPVTSAGQLAVNSPFKLNGLNAVKAASGKVTTTGKGTGQLGVDSGGRFFGVSEHAATSAGKGAFKTASKVLGWAAVAGLVWDIGTYAYSYLGQCAGGN
jgi:hypothetical protein